MQLTIAETKRAALWVSYHARKSGGLFLGFRVSFPFKVHMERNEIRNAVSFGVGLVILTIHLELRGPNLVVRRRRRA